MGGMCGTRCGQTDSVSYDEADMFALGKGRMGESE